MIATWPHTSPYAEAAARLRDAIDMAAIQDAVERLAASIREVDKANTANAQVSNNHATNIRDDLAALINEGAGLVDAASSARISEEGLA